MLLAATAAGQSCDGPVIPLTATTCGTVQALRLSCALPADIVKNPPNPIVAQRSADLFSWQEFFALNWPAKPGERGVPDDQRPITADGSRVWETWKESYEIFRPNGAEPAPWNSPPEIVSPCKENRKVLMRSQKIEDFGIDTELEAVSAQAEPPPTLTDQKGRLVRYEIRINKVMFDYIVKHKLYNGYTQAQLQDAVDLPSGSALVKAAWREVTPEEEKPYYAVTACVCERNDHGKPADCHIRRMALVGFHIAQRTPSAPQWIWTTFEHVDNVPGALARAHEFAFFNPNCPSSGTERCAPLNTQTLPRHPAQLKRVIPIPAKNPVCGSGPLSQEGIDNVGQLNIQVSAALRRAKSIFEKYELIGTQRPVPPVSTDAVTVFKATPRLLGNTVLESYVQETSTCIGCHSTARTTNPDKFVSAHFTFELNNAEPKPPNRVVMKVPDHPETAWEREHWKEIERGRELAEYTYELLPKFVPSSKLHCTSCHLDYTANSTAAWWVHLSDPDKYPTFELLAARINQCFEHSMNSHPLCDPKTTCRNDANMQSIIRYMEFLTGVYDRYDPPFPPPLKHGFPRIQNADAGDFCRGEATFIQKCAICHGADGLGRYHDDKYFRPALWGPHSFNATGQMFRFPWVLAEFVKFNMPRGAGGLLSDQEAWDVVRYVHGQSRPGDLHAPPTTCLR